MSRALGLFAALGIAMAPVLAQSQVQAQSTPAGLWKTVDDASKKETSLIRITDNAGAFSGRLEKLLEPGAHQDAVCDKCTDDRKDKPIVGMTIIRGVRQSDSDKGRWEGGDILDPNNGKTYRVRLTPLEAGKKLEVRGFIGPFYRNQIWLRAD